PHDGGIAPNHFPPFLGDRPDLILGQRNQNRSRHAKMTNGYSFHRLVFYFLRLGCLGFGGPIALAGHMNADLVEERGWVSRDEYAEGLAFAQLSPGPLAAQLAMYLGWIRGGIFCATITGIAFILPSFLMVFGIAGLYIKFGSLHWIQALFYSIG